MARWMINCKDYAILVSQQLDRPITFWDKVLIKLHQMICPPCNQIQKQFTSIREACRWIPCDEADADQEGCVLPDDARMRIKAALKDLKG
jgi:hypothetical protein